MSAYSALPTRTTSDLNSAADVNQLQTNITCALGTASAKSADYIITDTDGIGVVLADPSTKDVLITLPTLADNQGRKIIVKVTATGGGVKLDGEGAETIDGKAYFIMQRAYDFMEVIAGPSEWHILSCCLSINSGFVNTADWTNRELWAPSITYNNLTGTFQAGELVTETPGGNTWRIITDSGSVLTVKEATGTGIATNGRTLTGSSSGATATVNGNNKDADANILHNFNISYTELKFMLFVSSDATEANSRLIGIWAEGGADRGLQVFPVSDNACKLQTGSNGMVYQVDSTGAFVALDTEDYYFKILAFYVR